VFNGSIADARAKKTEQDSDVLGSEVKGNRKTGCFFNQGCTSIAPPCCKILCNDVIRKEAVWIIIIITHRLIVITNYCPY